MCASGQPAAWPVCDTGLMPRLRRNGGIGQIEAREGAANMVQPEITQGRGGSKTPMGTRQHARDGRGQRFETIRNGAPFVEYDPSPDARAERRRKYRLAWAALDRTAAEYGPRPQTIRGLPGAEAVRKPRRRVA
jgi:hypothetical protein